MENQLAQFDQLKADIALYVAPAKSVVVSDKDTQSKAMTSVKDVVGWKKKVEDKRKEMIAPLLERQREINEYAKQLTEPLIEAECHLKKQLIAWDQKLEAERQAELKRIALEAERKRKDAEEKAKKEREEAEALEMFGQKDDAVRSNLVAQAESERRSVEIDREVRKEEKAVLENKVSGIRTIWKYEVHEESKIPKEFWMINESAISKAVKSGVREIPGVRIYEEKTMGVR